MNVVFGFLFFIAGAVLIGADAWGLYDYGLHDGWPPYVVVGVVFGVLLSPFLPQMLRGLWRTGDWFTAAVAAVLVVTVPVAIVLTIASRTGSVADAAVVARAIGDQKIAAALAVKNEAAAARDEAKTAYDTAKANESAECDGKGQLGSQCRTRKGESEKAKGDLEAARSKLGEAEAALGNVAPVAADPMASRISRFTGIEEATVVQVWPFVWPTLQYLLGLVAIAAGQAFVGRRDEVPAAATSIGDVLAPITQVLPEIVSQKRGAKSSFDDLYEAYTKVAGRQGAAVVDRENFIAGIILCGHQAGWKIADGAVQGVTLKQVGGRVSSL